ncbi:MAG: alpha/beta hydrolase [Bacteroidales bacterium]|nr:alpha/beta hydrolase [Bacteroidales bacterium]
MYRFRTLLLFGILLLGMSACRDGRHEDKASQHKGRIPQTSQTLEVDDHDSFDFNKLDTIHYYHGEIEDSTFYFKIDKISPNGISGRYYRIGTTEWLSPKPFSILLKKRRYIYSSNGKEIPFKFKITIGKTAIFGTFSPSANPINKMDFAFEQYVEPPFKEYSTKRYKEETFSVEKNENVVYGQARGFWSSYPIKEEKYLKIFVKGIGQTASKKNLDLALDLYLPDKDTIRKRPLLILMHGGAFYFGDKGAETMTKWCEHFAKIGYVTASVNYRMGFRLSKASILQCGYEAIQDAHAAIRFLAAHADEYGIDPDNIFIGGTSAGSITALAVTFMRNSTRPPFVFEQHLDSKCGNLEASGNKLHPSFHIRAVANMWGAVYDLDELNGHHIPVISFHGTDDNIVPYDQGIPFSNISNIGEKFFDKMYGSKSIHKRLDSLKIRNEFYPIQGAGHSPYQDKQGHPNDWYYFIQNKMQDFFYKEITRIANITPVAKKPGSYQLKQEDIQILQWRAEGGFITSTEDNCVTVLWRKDAPNRKIIASGTRTNGTAFKCEKCIR